VRRRGAVGGWAAALGAGLAVACADAAPRPPVLLIVLDAAAAAYFGFHGDPHGTTPHLDALAEDAVVFENAYSQSATTAPSTASLLTGVRVQTHRVTGRRVLPESLETLGQWLRPAGYASVAVVGNPFAGSPALALDRGFDESVPVWALDSVQAKRDEEKSLSTTRPEDINAVVFRALPLLRRGPMLLYVHYLQPHMPYAPPSEHLERFLPVEAEGRRCPDENLGVLRRRWRAANLTGKAAPCTVAQLEARYRANLHYADAGVGRLLARLRREGLYEESWIALLSDHGDAFFGHGRFGHNAHLYDDMTRIPFLVKPPASAGARPRRVSALVETVDLAPTLLDFLGIEVPEQIEGDSLWPLLEDFEDVPGGSEVVMATVHRTRHALRAGDAKYIAHVSGEEELYDLAEDPAEQRNLASAEPARARELRERLLERVEVEADPGERGPSRPARDAVTRALLEQLGYIDGEISEGG